MTFQTFFIWVGVVLNENEKKREKKFNTICISQSKFNTICISQSKFNTICISQSKFKVTSVVIES